MQGSGIFLLQWLKHWHSRNHIWCQHRCQIFPELSFAWWEMHLMFGVCDVVTTGNLIAPLGKLRNPVRSTADNDWPLRATFLKWAAVTPSCCRHEQIPSVSSKGLFISWAALLFTRDWFVLQCLCTIHQLGSLSSGPEIFFPVKHREQQYHSF